MGIDVGGTKTLVAVLSNDGDMRERVRFPTPSDYKEFLHDLAFTIDKLTTNIFKAAGVGVPGKIDRGKGVALAFGRLPWSVAPIKSDIEKIVRCPVVVENDANLGGLSESILVKEKYNRVLYVTISTGIGTGIIDNQQIDPSFADSEGGEIVLEHNGKTMRWQDFASGKSILKTFGKQAKDINDPKTWHAIAGNLAIGLVDLIAIIQPEVIILGGGVSTYYSRFSKFLVADLEHYENALMPIPVIQQANRPDDAVLYGCYYLAKAHHG